MRPTSKKQVSENLGLKFWKNIGNSTQEKNWVRIVPEAKEQADEKWNNIEQTRDTVVVRPPQEIEMQYMHLMDGVLL